MIFCYVLFGCYGVDCMQMTQLLKDTINDDYNIFPPRDYKHGIPAGVEIVQDGDDL